MRRKLVGAFIVVVVLVIIGIICVVLVQGMKQSSQESKSKSTSDTFINYITSSKTDEAYTLLTDTAKKSESKLDWQRKANDYAVFFIDATIGEPKITNEDDKTIVTYNVILHNKTEAEITVYLKSQDDGGQKIDYFLVRLKE